MRHLILLPPILAFACGETSTRPAECKAFIDSFNRAMPQVEAASREMSGPADLTRLVGTMQKMANIYTALGDEIAAQKILDEQLRVRVEVYQDLVKQTIDAATIIAKATPETDVYMLNETQKKLQDLARKERNAVGDITGYCKPAP